MSILVNDTKRFVLLSIILVKLSSSFVFARALSSIDLASLSLEELASIEITSVSRQSENLANASASIYVITDEDIRRSGATTLPEILRLAPNLQVARIDSVQYAISARGFNNVVSNKLLVLIDGRTIYSPMYSGVFWEMQEIMPEDIERVEVISGPGGTLWGINAVNGVINIITQNSNKTHGLLVTGDTGNKERGASARWGGESLPGLTFRLFGKYRDWDNTYRNDETPNKDKWRRGQIGFRADWMGADQQLSLQGDTSRGESKHRGFAGAIEIPPVTVSATNLMANWTWELDNESTLELQSYWSHSNRDEKIIFRPIMDIFDLGVQHGFTINSNKIIWGGGYRYAKDKVEPGFITIFEPESRKQDWQNIFIQDEIQLTENIKFTAGMRLEWNDYTGREYLPNARIAWTPVDYHLLWTAVSRAVRSPSRYDRDVFFPDKPPFIVAGGPNFQSEIAHVFEAGYRGQPVNKLNLSATFFYHDWDDLRSGTSLPLPVFIANNIQGKSYGAEAWATWDITDYWRISGGVWAMEKKLEFDPGTSDTVGTENVTLHNDPEYQWRVGASFDLPWQFELDLKLRRVNELTVQPVPAYNELDIRLAWYPAENIELSIQGRNVLHKSHPEFGDIATRSVLSRSTVFGLKWLL